jgi:hypothetical protein
MRPAGPAEIGSAGYHRAGKHEQAAVGEGLHVDLAVTWRRE